MQFFDYSHCQVSIILADMGYLVSDDYYFCPFDAVTCSFLMNQTMWILQPGLDLMTPWWQQHLINQYLSIWCHCPEELQWCIYVFYFYFLRFYIQCQIVSISENGQWVTLSIITFIRMKNESNNLNKYISNFLLQESNKTKFNWVWHKAKSVDDSRCPHTQNILLSYAKSSTKLKWLMTEKQSFNDLSS